MICLVWMRLLHLNHRSQRYNGKAQEHRPPEILSTQACLLRPAALSASSLNPNRVTLTSSRSSRLQRSVPVLLTRILAVLQHHLKAQLLAALQQLSNRHREALYLKFFDGFAYDRIAEIMDLNQQSVRNLVHQAIKRMRQVLPSPLLLLLHGLFLNFLL